MMNCVICLSTFVQFLALTLVLTYGCWFLGWHLAPCLELKITVLFFFNPRPVKHLFALSQPTQSFCIGIFCFLARGELCVFFSEILVKCTVSGSSGVWLPLMTRGDECQARHQAATSQAQGGPRRAGEHVRDDKPVQVCIRTFRQLQYDDTRPRTI